MRLFERRMESIAGMTLVEIIVVIAITGIAMTGMLVAYTGGVRHMRHTTDLITMYDEGTAALTRMTPYIRNARHIRIHSNAGSPNARLELDYPEDWGSATFYFVGLDKSLRWNDQTMGNNKFNMKLIPFSNFPRNVGDDPYIMVKNTSFTPLDYIGPPSPILEGFTLIRIEMVLENTQGDTLYLSSVVSKRNKL